MKFFDFQLNIPAECLKHNLPDQFVTVYYGVEDGRIYLVEYGVGTELAKIITDWVKLESTAQSVAEEKEASKEIEKAEWNEEFENLKSQITY